MNGRKYVAQIDVSSAPLTFFKFSFRLDELSKKIALCFLADLLASELIVSPGKRGRFLIVWCAGG